MFIYIRARQTLNFKTAELRSLGYYASFDTKDKNIRFEINHTKLPENHVEKFMDDKKTILLVNGGFGIGGSLSLVINQMNSLKNHLL